VTMKIEHGMIDLPEDFHKDAVDQFVAMIQLYTNGGLATVPMATPDGRVFPAIVSVSKPQVTYGILFVPPIPTAPTEQLH
jgi:hypothetical protein